MKAFLNEYLHRWLITALLCSGALSVFMWLTGAPVHTFAVLLILFVWIGLLSVLDRLWRWPAVLGLTIAAAIIALWAADDAAMVKYVSALFGSGRAPLSVNGDVVVLLVMGLLSAALLYGMRGFWPRAMLCAGWIVFWLISAVLELKVPKLALAAMAPVILFTLVQALHLARSRRDKGRFEELSSGLMSMFFAASLFLMIMPTSTEPYGYPLLNALWDSVSELYRNIEAELFYRGSGTEQFGMSFNGYSDEAGVGGGLRSNREGVLLAKPRYDTDGSLYLAGNSWDTFAGEQWQSTVDEETTDLLDWNMDTAEHIYALWRYRQGGELSADDFFRETNVYITYQDVRLRTLFTARNLLLINTDEIRFPWQAQAGRVMFDYLQKNDTYYCLYYLEENSYYIDRLIESSEGYEYDAQSDIMWLKVHQEFREDFVLSLARSIRIEQALAQREELIRGTYLSLPEDISDQVRALALEITAGCGSDYEKLMAIESYLQTNFSYTTRPTEPPEGSSFLDYMLFEGREGYCTWYATAATLLARCVDVPARYVQGYSVTLKEGEFTTIDSSYSHAWCEGYVAGYGWVTVEATPGFSASGFGWGRSFEAAEGSGNSAGTGGSYYEEEEEFYEEPITAQPAAPEGEGESLAPRIILIALVASALGVMLVVVVRFDRQQREYNAGDFSQKAVIDLGTALRILARRGYRRRPEESLRRYFNRIKWSIRIDAKQLERMAIMYEEVIFGERQLKEEQWQESRQFLSTVRRIRRK